MILFFGLGAFSFFIFIMSIIFDFSSLIRLVMKIPTSIWIFSAISSLKNQLIFSHLHSCIISLDFHNFHVSNFISEGRYSQGEIDLLFQFEVYKVDDGVECFFCDVNVLCFSIFIGDSFPRIDFFLH
jgi:hypothetical protein